MGFEFLKRVRKTSLILGLFLAPIIATYCGLKPGGAWIMGVAWSLVNLHFITQLMRNVITGEKRKYLRIGLLLMAKFPVLYTAGYFILKSGVFPAAWLVIGITWPFFVTTMKALGRVLLHLDEPVALQLKKERNLFLRVKS